MSFHQYNRPMNGTRAMALPSRQFEKGDGSAGAIVGKLQDHKREFGLNQKQKERRPY